MLSIDGVIVDATIANISKVFATLLSPHDASPSLICRNKNAFPTKTHESQGFFWDAPECTGNVLDGDRPARGSDGNESGNEGRRPTPARRPIFCHMAFHLQRYASRRTQQLVDAEQAFNYDVVEAR